MFIATTTRGSYPKVEGRIALGSGFGLRISKWLDVGAAMIPEDGNTVVLLGEGADGASATVTLGDAPAGDPMLVANPIALQMRHGGLHVSDST